MTTKSLLVELFVEELPPKSLRRLGEAFSSGIASKLGEQGLTGEHSAVTAYASPRRLAVHVSGVRSVAPDKEETRKLMPLSVGIDGHGRATEALRKNLGKLGRSHLADLWPDAVDGPDRLVVETDGKAEVLYLRSMVKGSSIQVGLQNALDDAIDGLPIPKVMQYQLADGWTSVHFVRPAHGLVALHGAEVVPVQVLGLTAGRQTQGHRFEAAMTPVVLQDADHYARQLEEQGAVIASFADRRGEIARQLQAAASREGLTPIDDDALLDEVTALVERPNVLLCRFDEPFLEVPQECLILTMKVNQKYFPLLDAGGRLTNRFLVVSNIRPDDPGRVVGGNERVVRPRLADAKFFFDQDRKRTLASRVPALDKVVYHGKLGSLGERVQRVRTIAGAIARALGGEAAAALADRAALLAKADLTTDMVGEFPELQGTMGAYYARHDGEPDDVAFAIEDHYRPRFAGDVLPRNATGVALALADKLETLAGLFGIGQLPTGDKDPFALRRHALGVIRLLTERSLSLPLDRLVKDAFGAFPAGMLADARGAVETFVLDRFAGMLREQGYSAIEVDAVLCLRPMRLDLVPRQLEAVRAFAELPEAASLAAANKRIANILKKSEAATMAAVDETLLAEDAERQLHGALKSVQPLADALFDNGEYAASLREWAALRPAVDGFFDGVMVNADDPALRANRLGLLAALHRAMNRVADLSRLAA